MPGLHNFSLCPHWSEDFLDLPPNKVCYKHARERGRRAPTRCYSTPRTPMKRTFSLFAAVLCPALGVLLVSSRAISQSAEPPAPAPAAPGPGLVAPPAPPAESPKPPEDDTKLRADSLQEHNSIFGASGLLRT